MIIGSLGSGKSTVARQVGERTGLPVIHLDRIAWLPGWVERDRAERDDLIRAEAAQERWVIEGGYSGTYPERPARADLIVRLNRPLPLRLFRVYRRLFQYRRGRERPDMTECCPEKVDYEFLHCMLTTFRRQRKRNLGIMAEQPPGRMIRLNSPRAVATWLTAL